MGRTSKPLTIVALPPCDTWDELYVLEKQGHRVVRVSDNDPLAVQFTDSKFLCSLLLEADLILGANCWRMDHKHKTYVSLAIKEARMLKYANEDSHDIKKRKSISNELRIPDGAGIDDDGNLVLPDKSSSGVSDE